MRSPKHIVPGLDSARTDMDTCSGRCFFKENGVRCSACKELSVYPDMKRVLLVSEEKGTRLAARNAMTARKDGHQLVKF